VEYFLFHVTIFRRSRLIVACTSKNFKFTHVPTLSFISSCILSRVIFLSQVLFLTEILDWTQLFAWMENDYHPLAYSFGYAHQNGPHTWKDLYPESGGCNQSPVNIVTRLAVVVQPSERLQWSNYNSGPLSMTITNDGHTGTRAFSVRRPNGPSEYVTEYIFCVSLRFFLPL